MAAALFHGGGKRGEYQALFSRFAGSCDRLVHHHWLRLFRLLSERLSGGSRISQCRVVDSRNLLSTGQGATWSGGLPSEDQASLDGLCRRLEQLTGKVEASFPF